MLIGFLPLIELIKRSLVCNNLLQQINRCTLLCYSLLDRRGYVVPDSTQAHVSGPETHKERESNSVNVRHEYYGSTTVTNQKVRLLSAGSCTPCFACLPAAFPVLVSSRFATLTDFCFLGISDFEFRDSYIGVYLVVMLHYHSSSMYVMPCVYIHMYRWFCLVEEKKTARNLHYWQSELYCVIDTMDFGWFFVYSALGGLGLG